GGTGQQDVAAERRAAVASGIQRGVERDRAAAGRRLARIVGRELDVPAIGGDRAVDYDAVAGECRDANALGRDIDRIGEGDVLRRLEDHIASRGVDGRRRDRSPTIGDDDVGRIEQPGSDRTLRRQRVDRAGADGEVGGARGFDIAAIAAVGAAARGDRAVEHGVLLRPHRDPAAIAVVGRVGGNGRTLLDGHILRVGQRAGAVEIAADQHQAATGLARGVDIGADGEVDIGARYLYRAAGAARRQALRTDRAADRNTAVRAAVENDGAVLDAD